MTHLDCTRGFRIAVPLASILGISAATAADLPDPVASGELPQYVFFSKPPTRGGPFPWCQDEPEWFTRESVEDVVKTIGTRGNRRLKIGVSFPFSILENDADTLSRGISNLLKASEAADVPVLITLDGQNWWQNRPDLWNWWDRSRPGYNPDNALNVEWTGWGPQHAVKIGWRNWGFQFRCAPAPNLASPKFLAEHWKKYDVLIPLIMRWYRALPPERRYLFGGLKVGWEASNNVNAFYYRDGNALIERLPKDASKDPDDHKPDTGWAFGQQPLGYAAVYTSGTRKSGELTKEDLEKVVFNYLQALAREAHERGVPRNMIFTHQGGTFAPWEKHLSFRPAINEYSIPGWSFYTHEPAESGSLAADLEAAGRQQWVAAEWWRGSNSAKGWRKRFEGCLRFKSCRSVSVYGWGAFRESPEAKQGLRDLVARAASQPASAESNPAESSPAE
jgi:hypothetical protein